MLRSEWERQTELSKLKELQNMNKQKEPARSLFFGSSFFDGGRSLFSSHLRKPFSSSCLNLFLEDLELSDGHVRPENFLQLTQSREHGVRFTADQRFLDHGRLLVGT